MNYEVVQLNEMKLVGIHLKTSNEDPQMPHKIHALWENFYTNGIYTSIKNKRNSHTIGLYYDYTNEGYTVIVGCEVLANENKDLVSKNIPKGTYAKFTLEGALDTVVTKAWQEIWKMDLNRSFTGDFEEYVDVDNPKHAKINIYIALQI